MIRQINKVKSVFYICICLWLSSKYKAKFIFQPLYSQLLHSNSRFCKVCLDIEGTKALKGGSK